MSTVLFGKGDFVRILLLTQLFDPEPQLKGLNFAKRLVEMGHSVSVLTGFPNYPGGKIYPNYKLRLLQREYIEGVEIIRVPLYPSHDQSSFRRILNYVSFCFSAIVYGIFFLQKPDVMYVYHPPITTGVSAAVIGFLRKVPFVLDIQDMWPDTLRVSGMVDSNFLYQFINSICNWVYGRADKIVVLSEGFKSLLEGRKIHSDKISVIYNWCDEQRIGEVAPKCKMADEPFNVVFAGTMGTGQALESVIEAAVLLKDYSNIKLQFIGEGTEVSKLKTLVLKMNLNNIQILPGVPMEKINDVFNIADALLVHLKRDELFKITIPSKTQAYLYSGRPIIMAVQGEASDILIRAKAGICVEPENPQALAQAILQLSQLEESKLVIMSENGRQYYAENMSFETGVKKFSNLFHQMLN
jgi:colanic acid biosynthesis glycosyl transferase WcaI